MALELAEPETISRVFELKSGDVAAELSGPEDGRLVIGIPGLSANLRSFDVIFGALDAGSHRRLAYDPRGRGRSAKTPAGTYGYPAQVADILEMADQLGARSFDLVGWSMGAWIAMSVCQTAPGRVHKLVLLDALGVPDDSAKPPIYAGLERLGTVYPSRDAFDEASRAAGVFEPWEFWSRYFDYEFEEVDGGVRARTEIVGPWEDNTYRESIDVYGLWPAVTMPTLVVRATREILPGLGFILNQADTDRFLREVPSAQLVEVDSNHYGVGLHPNTAKAIAEFLSD